MQEGQADNVCCTQGLEEKILHHTPSSFDKTDFSKCQGAWRQRLSITFCAMEYLLMPNFEALWLVINIEMMIN